MLKEHPDGEHSVNPDVKSESSTQSALQVVAIGASAVVIPYALLGGVPALVTAIVLAVVGMLVVGGLVGRVSGRGVAFSAGRQLLWGVGAAAVTYAVGSVVGVNAG